MESNCRFFLPLLLVAFLSLNIRKALRVLPQANIWVGPDCGLKTRTVEEAIAKMAVLVEGTRQVRTEMGLE